MIKKIFFQSIFFNFFFLKEVFSAESGGMPQLDPEFWISQIFWLTITFGILYLVLSKFILPKISKNIEFRESQILDNIEFAEKQKVESENKIKEYESLILKSKNESRNYFNETRKKILQDIDKKIIQLEKELNEEIDIAEKEITAVKNSAPEKINKIAVETTSSLIQQLIGEEVNNSSISAIVDDLSKKNKGKYYGN